MTTGVIFTFRDGVVAESLEQPNAWGSGMFVWANLFDEHCRDPVVPHDNVLLNSGKLWPLYKDRALPMFKRAALMASMDDALVMRRDFAEYVKHLRELLAHYGTHNRACHLPGWIEFIEKNPDADAVGFWHTSVCENPWHERDIRAAGKHFDTYHELREIDAEAVPT